eukprot:306381-Chlamydomonas_euryale.AAC.7
MECCLVARHVVGLAVSAERTALLLRASTPVRQLPPAPGTQQAFWMPHLAHGAHLHGAPPEAASAPATCSAACMVAFRMAQTSRQRQRPHAVPRTARGRRSGRRREGEGSRAKQRYRMHAPSDEMRGGVRSLQGRGDCVVWGGVCALPLEERRPGDRKGRWRAEPSRPPDSLQIVSLRQSSFKRLRHTVVAACAL